MDNLNLAAITEVDAYSREGCKRKEKEKKRRKDEKKTFVFLLKGEISICADLKRDLLMLTKKGVVREEEGVSRRGQQSSRLNTLSLFSSEGIILQDCEITKLHHFEIW